MLGCYVTLDTTDFCITELSQINKKWFSQKFKAATFRYEIVIYMPGIVVLHQVSLAVGKRPGIKLFRSRVSHIVDDGKQILPKTVSATTRGFMCTI